MPTILSSSIPARPVAGSLSTTRAAVPAAVTIPSNNAADKNQFLGLDAFSPVNQNGSFEFDRVIKSGDVNKRSRKTKQWKRFYLILRPNVLSVYKDSTEAKLLKQLHLNDVTAVAILKDPKGRRGHMFGVFSPSRNFHFQATSDTEARSWVESIKREARVDEDEPISVFGSPPTSSYAHQSLNRYILSGDEGEAQDDRQVSSSPEPIEVPTSFTTTRDGVRIPAIREDSYEHGNLDYSGPEQGSFSDFSDTGPTRGSKPVQIPRPAATIDHANMIAVSRNSNVESQPRPSMSGMSGSAAHATGNPEDIERVIYHGWLLVLKSKRGVRQWKRLWTVLRPHNITFYKSEDEYAAQLILPMSSVLSAVEIDPISKTKSNCIQIITEEKSFRFSAPSEEAVARWLGAIQSQLAKRNQRRAQREGEA